jgi:hypothetical protein
MDWTCSMNGNDDSFIYKPNDTSTFLGPDLITRKTNVKMIFEK